MSAAFFRSFFFLFLLAWGLASDAQEVQAQMGLPHIRIRAGMYQIDAQVASTPEQRQMGLMHRRSMATHEGMLFIFEHPFRACFWMKNTPIPLTAAFIDDDGVIVNLADMAPQTTNEHCARRPVRFVLEMNQGWFSKRRIEAGYTLKSPVFSDKR